MALTNYLYNLFFLYIKNHGEKIIKIFILMLKSDAKKEYLEDFCNDGTKI